MAFEVFKVEKEIIWNIKNFTKDVVMGTSLLSKCAILSYDQNVTEWCMRLYPNGHNHDNKGHLGLLLSLHSYRNNEFLVKGSFTVRNQNGFETKEITTEREGQACRNAIVDSLFSHQEISEHVENCSEITIICKLSIYEKMRPNENSSVRSIATIQDDFKKMFDEEILCDLDIKTNDSVILKAHKNILAARSPVFLKMLTTNMKEAKTSTVEIDDFDSKTIRELLRYIYCEEVDDFENNAKDLIYAAEKYEVTELKKKCIKEITSKVTKENFTEALIIADQISGTEKITKACVPLVSMYYRDLLEDPKCKKLPQDILLKLMAETLDKYLTCHV